MTYELTPLQKAVALAGNQSELARQIGVKQQNVWTWLNKTKSVPAEYVTAIERVTGIPRHELRPDIFEARKPSKPTEKAKQ